jgi:hypothetical protein
MIHHSACCDRYEEKKILHLFFSFVRSLTANIGLRIKEQA